LSNASIDDGRAGAPLTAPAPEGVGADVSPGPAAAGPPHRGRRTWGKVARDGLLLFVILAMGLPFVVSQFGRADLSASERQLAAAARRTACRQDDWLANAVSNKTAAVERFPGGGLRLRQEYYTFFGVPWGWSQVTIDAHGRIVQIDTKLTAGSDVRSVRPPG
jgi:hypothetical protein